MKKHILLFTLIFTAITTAFAYQPPDGGEEIYHLYSPFFLSGGTSVTSTDSPYADTYNPAASGATQRTTLDLSYIALAQLNDTPAYTGTIVNLGATFPTRIGVFTTSGHFLSSQAGLPLGTLGNFRFSFAKDLYPHILVGTGLQFTIGENQNLDWGLAADLGFIHLAGDQGIFKDFRWGIAMQNMGKWYAPLDAPSTAYPSPFTPAAGLSFTILQTEPVDIDFRTNLQFPAFQNVRFDAGSTVTLFDVVGLHVSGGFDLRSLLEDHAPRSFPLSGGISVHLTTNFGKEKGEKPISDWSRSEVNPIVSFTPLQDNVFAFGAGVTVPLGQIDNNPPRISVGYSKMEYISPNNDGVSDDLLLPIEIDDERYIKGYNLKIYNEKGELVKEIQNKEKRPETQGLNNIIQRLAVVKSGIVVPETLRWDGTADAGFTITDGVYRFTLESWDDNGNLGKTEEYAVTVDSTPPSIELEQPEQINIIFSPNGDGNKDSLAIEQSGSAEDLWEGAFVSADGTVVRGYTWTDGKPESFAWDGKTDSGEFAADGVYTYRLTSADRAGNVTTGTIDNIIKNTQETPVNVTISTANFSPNGDGVKDDVTFDLSIPVQQGIVSWTVELKNSGGSVVEKVTGTEEVPDSYTFTGRGRDNTVLPEGTYHATIGILYRNGNNPVADSPSFTLDLTPPDARIVPQDTIFSPNGDGNKEEMVFRINASEEDVWTGRLTSSEDGTPAAEYSWAGTPDRTVRWRGKSEDGRLMQDGIYEFVIEATDRAGNRGSSNRVVFELSTIETPVTLAAGDDAFSPNNDNRKDVIELLPELEVETGIERWSVSIVSEEGDIVSRFEGGETIEPPLEWDGNNRDGLPANEGTYRGLLTVVYLNGNVSEAASGPFILDITDPAASVYSDFAVFSPNDDNRKDTITFFHDTSEEEVWQGIIQDPSGKTVKTFSWSGKAPQSVSWDGRGDDKIMVQDGNYSYRLRSVDRAGNGTESRPVLFKIDTEQKPVFLSAEYDAFSPNGDGVKDIVPLIPQLKTTKGIASWELSVLDRGDQSVYQDKAVGPVEDRYTWNGRTTEGSRAAEGTYRAELTVVYENGTRSTASSGRFVLDVTKPSADVTGKADIFSPNDDGRKETILFTQTSSEEKLWRGTITDKQGVPVKQFEWHGTVPDAIEWNGRQDNQKVASDGDYSYRLFSTDDAGNSGESRQVSFTLDTRETPVFVSVGRDAFSPNGDGIKDSVTFFPTVKESKGIESWKLEVLDRNNRVIKTYDSGTRVPAEIEWDGKDQIGRTVFDGPYRIDIEIRYSHGNIGTAQAGPIMLDTTPPEIDVSTDYLLFSPNGDGRKDEVRFTQQSSDERLWEGTLFDEQGKAVKSFIWKNRAEPFSWDGTDEVGNKVRNGDYRYRVSATDQAGNSGKAETEVTVDNRYTYSFITVDKYAFSPNSDDYYDEVNFSLTVGLREGIDSWKLELVHDSEGVQKSYSDKGAPPPSSIVWNGRSESGLVVEGTYTAVLTVDYRKGDRNLEETKPFILDVSPPAVEVRLTPTPFSPDNDGIDDELNIWLQTEEAGRVEDWQLSIDDPKGKRFYSFEGDGMPADHLIWDGRSEEGELVQSAEDYPYTLSIRDELGNSRTIRGKIPVDVLVIREDGKLKIRISSINFMPNSAELVTEEQDEELYAKNIRVLEMLAEKLKKYNTYDIRLEGHAVRVYWDDPERGAREEKEELLPLSLARAETVKRALRERGIAAYRMTTEGLGGTQPIVPHGDLENRWKNRRVEFILLK